MPLSTRFGLEADFQISRLQTFNVEVTGVPGSIGTSG